MLDDNLKLNDENTGLLIIGTPQQLEKVVITQAVVQVCLRTIVMQMRLVAIQSLLNFGVMTVYSGHPKGNICN